METKFTPGPWFVDANGKVWRRDPRNLYENGGSVAGDHPIATAHRGWPYWEDGFPVEANARLIAAAPDHAMFGRAITSLGARWEKWDEKRGEFCIGWFRYATDIDEFGVPVLNAPIRAAIAKAEGR